MSFEQMRLTVMQLLEDHSQIYQGGESFPDFAELGPATAEGHFPLNASLIRRYFQDHPKEMQAISRYFLDSQEAESHLLLEGKLRELRSQLPDVVGPVDAIHFRSTAGNKDAQHVRDLAKESFDAASFIRIYDCCIDLLALWFVMQNIELYATFARRKTIREEKKAEEFNKRLYYRYMDLEAQNKKAKDIKDIISAEEAGLSHRRIEQIVQSQREILGKEKRDRGRPSKKGA